MSRARRASRDDGQVSPTSTTAAGRGPLSPSSTTSSVSVPDRRLSDLTNYRRDLAAIDGSQGGGSRNASIGGSAGGGISLASTSSYAAPWMSMGGSVPSRGLPTSFYNDSSDSLSVASQLSPALPSSATFGGASASSASASAAPFHAGAPSAAAAGLAGPARPFAAPQPPLGPGAPHESPDAAYFSPDARRPSVASVTTTASSQGSKASVTRGGFRKLQGFFGEEFPGRDSSESSLPISLGKDQRSRSYSHTRPSHRDRNYSNATDPRDASPSSSRPRTPVPAPEVVPFLYQDNTVRAVHRLPVLPLAGFSPRSRASLPPGEATTLHAAQQLKRFCLVLPVPTPSGLQCALHQCCLPTVRRCGRCGRCSHPVPPARLRPPRLPSQRPPSPPARLSSHLSPGLTLITTGHCAVRRGARPRFHDRARPRTIRQHRKHNVTGAAQVLLVCAIRRRAPPGPPLPPPQ